MPGLQTNVYSVTGALQKGLQVISQGYSFILKKTQPRFDLMRKWKTLAAKDFLLLFTQNSL